MAQEFDDSGSSPVGAGADHRGWTDTLRSPQSSLASLSYNGSLSSVTPPSAPSTGSGETIQSPSPPKHACITCGKTFSRSSSLNVHKAETREKSLGQPVQTPIIPTRCSDNLAGITRKIVHWDCSILVFCRRKSAQGRFGSRMPSRVIV